MITCLLMRCCKCLYSLMEWYIVDVDVYACVRRVSVGMSGYGKENLIC